MKYQTKTLDEYLNETKFTNIVNLENKTISGDFNPYKSNIWKYNCFFVKSNSLFPYFFLLLADELAYNIGKNALLNKMSQIEYTFEELSNFFYEQLEYCKHSDNCKGFYLQKYVTTDWTRLKKDYDDEVTEIKNSTPISNYIDIPKFNKLLVLAQNYSN